MSRDQNDRPGHRGYQPFGKPWNLEERGESFHVTDSAGRTLSFVHFEDDPIRRDMMRRLSKADARKIAEQIQRLPKLVALERRFKN